MKTWKSPLHRYMKRRIILNTFSASQCGKVLYNIWYDACRWASTWNMWRIFYAIPDIGWKTAFMMNASVTLELFQLTFGIRICNFLRSGAICDGSKLNAVISLAHNRFKFKNNTISACHRIHCQCHSTFTITTGRYPISTYNIIRS